MSDWFNSSAKTKGEDTKEPPIPYKSRRSPVVCTNGCVATSQPLASSIGIQFLMRGGNAADASLAIAAALAVTEPCSTGLGGDMFALYYNAKKNKVNIEREVKTNKFKPPLKINHMINKQKIRNRSKSRGRAALRSASNGSDSDRGFNESEIIAINASGRCPGNLNLDIIREKYPDGNGAVDTDAHLKSVDSVTVPGAPRGWEEFYNAYGSGKFTFLELLEPAAKLAEDGFPVAPITAKSWSNGLESDIKKWISDDEIANGKEVPLSIEGRGPKAGEIVKNPDMAKVLRSLGKHGATKGFYEAFPGIAIINAIQKHGGVMTMDDLTEERTQCTFPQPISVEYNGLKLHQIPPNGQGIAGLIALSGIAALEENNLIPKSKAKPDASGWESVETLHAMIEMMRLGFRDAREFVCDEEFHMEKKQTLVSSDYLIDKRRISEKATQVYNPSKALVHGMPSRTSGTVSFQVVDKEGNAVSFVNSNFMGFGTGIVPEGCGFSLQNRGAGFSFDEKHLNVIEPYKRPYHTIIPGMLTHADTGELFATISNMGGFMQPQGHMQLTVALASGLDPQTAIDQPRFCIADGTHNGAAMIEEGVDSNIITQLKKKGHLIEANVSGYSRAIFGKAQIIKRDRETGVLWAGSDGRSDGCAIGY